VNLLTPEQQSLLSGALTGIGPDALSTFGSFLQPQTPGDIQEIFQQSYVDPALQTFQQQIVPSIQQRFADANAASSSALNQALAQSAGDLSTSLGSQYGQFFQNQQQQQLQALNQFLPLITGKTFSPVFHQSPGILGSLIGIGGQLGAAGLAASSKNIKENIKSYEKGLDSLKELTVKQYDYIEEVGGQKNKVGLIAEDVPEELTTKKDGILHVDLYGVMGLMINAIQELNEKVIKLEGK